MSTQTPSENPQPLSVILEVIPDDPNEAAIAETYAVGRDTADALGNDGYTVQPVYTGRRGGFLVDVVFPLLTMMWAQKEVILADLSELIAILTPCRRGSATSPSSTRTARWQGRSTRASPQNHSGSR